MRAGEGTRLREIRLRALGDAPAAFFSSLESERGWPVDHWEAQAGASEAGDAEVTFVAVEDEVWLGMATGRLLPDRGTAGLEAMWVAPTARGRGVGRRLTEEVTAWAREQRARRLELAVTETNRAAIALYAGLGFEPTGKRRALVSDPRLVGIFMTRAL